MRMKNNQQNLGKKLTREERKIDAYMRAFLQMEKAQKRKQQALERMKAQQPKVEEPPAEKVEPATAEKEVEKSEKAALTPPTDSHCEEETKPTPSVPKTKKGKRRRGSGTPVRRRTRTNSGGSDILHLEETQLLPSAPVAVETPAPTVPEPPSPITDTPEPNTCTITPLTPETVVPTPGSPVSVPAPTTTPILAATSPVALKMKKFLLHEWLQEKSEVVSPTVSSPRALHTEVKWNITADSPTCYVRCTKDTPHSGGISAAHLRRSNSCIMRSVGGQGSAKKRWLRQAMNDCGGSEEQLNIDSSSMEHLENGCMSPNSHCDVDSPGALNEADMLTPLKKRRLMRESLESAPSPRSPFIETSLDDTDGTSSSLVNDTPSDQKCDLQLQCLGDDDSMQLSPVKGESLQKLNDITEHPGVEIIEKVMEYEEAELFSTSNENNTCADEDIAVKCSSEAEVQSNDCDPTVELKPSEGNQDFKTLVEPNETLRTCELKLEEPSLETIRADAKNLVELVESTPLDLNYENSSCAVLNQSPSKAEENSDEDNEVAQRQSHVSSTLSVNSPVNNESHINMDCKSEPINQPPSEASVAIEKPEDNKDSDSSLVPAAESNLTDQLSMQDKLEVISPCENPLPNPPVALSDDDADNSNVVNNKSDDIDSTNDRPSKSSDEALEKIECSNISSSVVISDSVSDQCADSSEEVKAPEIGESNIQDSNAGSDEPAKSCASATQKRKVSLSEYRMRMRENTKPRSSVESPSKTITSSISATMIPDTLPEKVTLAPLPLFDSLESSKANKLAALKNKKDSVSGGEEKADEQRENLNERLKREFGFDISEAGLNKKNPGCIQPKGKCNNQTSSSSGHIKAPLSVQRPPPSPPPPPPPPPRPIHSPQPVTPVQAPVPSQFGFVHTPFPRTPYVVPPPVPVARPFIPPQPSLVAPPPPIMPPVHPSIRPPLLPSSHSFTPSLPGTIIRTVTRHEFAQINAQRFTSMVHQPPALTPKTYPHVFPSGLYK